MNTLDSKYNHLQWAGEEYLPEEITAESGLTPTHTGGVFPPEIMYWISYIYRYWSISKNESSKNIYKQACAKTMKRNYLIFHTMNPEMAIDDLIEIHWQKHRK